MIYKFLDYVLKDEHIKEMQIALILHLHNKFGKVGICDYKNKDGSTSSMINTFSWYQEQKDNAVDITDNYFKYQGFRYVTNFYEITLENVSVYCCKNDLDYKLIDQLLKKYIAVGTKFRELGTV